MLLASFIPMQAQYVTVNGLVKDAQTNERLQGANIYLKQINKGQISDRNGRFTLSLPHNKKLEMTISFVGYQAQQIPP